MRIRKVSGRDREALVSIINGCGNLTGEEKGCAVELLDIYLKDPRQKDYYFIAAADEMDFPAGYVCYGPRPLTQAAYDLYWIVVDGRLRRKGVAKMLLEYTEEILRGEGAALLIAETSGLKEYEPARSLYLRNGFTEEARIREFYEPGDDLVIFVKRY